MLKDFFLKKTIENFGYEPTEEQKFALNLFAEFLFDSSKQVFILNGYAGTGKTTFIKSIVNTLDEFRYSYVLLAPTGRAAKVLSNFCRANSYTIHKFIYKQKSSTDFRFVLNFQSIKNTIFFVDEASLISNDFTESNIFGSGRLLDDLLEYVFAYNSNKLVLIGDTAQLPPVGASHHPALDQKNFEQLSFNVCYVTLKEVVRQHHESHVLINATKLRNNIIETINELPIFTFSTNEFEYVESIDLLETISASYRNVGLSETIILTYSNKRALQINRTVRDRILGYDEEVVNGECLMVVKNNYMSLPDELPFSFIANGEIIHIHKILKEKNMYDFRFLKTIVKLSDFPDIELDCFLLLDTLHSEYPSLSKEQNDKLFNNILEDYKDIKNKKKQIQLVRENEYFKAIQVKYAYAVTAHKAQGGQWKHVYIDASFLNYNEIRPEILKWFYTAITRATEKVYIFGLPSKYVDKF
jgi:exodeoxyribonuclease-5